MPRHPLYLLLCASSFAYLLWANSRGYSPFYASKSASSASRVAGARLMHK
jgi:hypothetical protein